jgi:RHS repeat-associated protein
VPVPYPEEFRRDVVAVARQGDRSRAQVARSWAVPTRSTYGTNDTTGFTGIDKPDPAQPDKPVDNVYRYTGKRWDPSSGGYDMGFRDYSPGLNRFLTRDTYNGALADLHLGADPYTGNRYALAAGNPITGVELDGHLSGAACGPDGITCGMTDMASSAAYTPVATETAPAAARPAYPAGEVPEQIAQASGPARQDWIYHRLQDLHAGIHDQDGLDRYNQLKTAYCAEFTDPWCQGPTFRAAAAAGADLAMIFFPWGRLLNGLRILGRTTTAGSGSLRIVGSGFPRAGATWSCARRMALLVEHRICSWTTCHMMCTRRRRATSTVSLARSRARAPRSGVEASFWISASRHLRWSRSVTSCPGCKALPVKSRTLLCSGVSDGEIQMYMRIYRCHVGTDSKS